MLYTHFASMNKRLGMYGLNSVHDIYIFTYGYNTALYQNNNEDEQLIHFGEFSDFVKKEFQAQKMYSMNWVKIIQLYSTDNQNSLELFFKLLDKYLQKTLKKRLEDFENKDIGGGIKPEMKALILAAGQSKRLGRPKQLLTWKGKTLIEHAINYAFQSGAMGTFVVLGGNREKIEPSIKEKVENIVYNPNYAEGMGTSLAIGVKTILEKHPETEKILVLLSDQPLVNEEHLKQLYVMQVEKKCPIVATKYLTQLGVPAIFDQSVFPDLLKMAGDKGAKALFDKYPTESILFEGAKIDIDTLADYQFLLTLS